MSIINLYTWERLGFQHSRNDQEVAVDQAGGSRFTLSFSPVKDILQS